MYRIYVNKYSHETSHAQREYATCKTFKEACEKQAQALNVGYRFAIIRFEMK